MSFLAQDPRKSGQEQQRPNYTQVGPMAQSQPGLGDKLTSMATNKLAGAAMTPGGLVGKAAVEGGTAATSGLFGAGGAIAPTSGSLLGGLTGAGAATTGTGAAAAGGMAAMSPMLAAAGPFALMALPFLLNNGTSSVPGNYNNGTTQIPEQDFGPDPLAQGYNNGTQGVQPTTNMNYAGGTDSVPAMLTPGEAIIPAAAAQNPANKPAIDSMVNEGRAANHQATTQDFPGEYTMQGAPQVTTSNIGSPESPSLGQQPSDFPSQHMAGPLSGKSQREQMKLVQDMSLKKKSWEAEELRKQEAFKQKMSQGNMKAMLAMRQSQE
jgi:hypothetical protein